MQVFLLTIALASSRPLAAQQSELASDLAGEVCACITHPDRQELKDRPRRCLTRVAGANRERILATFGLRASSINDRRQLGNLLIPYLAENCPSLVDYHVAREGDFSWSDAPTTIPFRYNLPVSVPIPPESARDSPTERAVSVEQTGILREIDGDILYLETAAGRRSYYFPKDLGQGLLLSIGQVYAVSANWGLLPDRKSFAYVVNSIQQR